MSKYELESMLRYMPRGTRIVSTHGEAGYSFLVPKTVYSIEAARELFVPESKRPRSRSPLHGREEQLGLRPARESSPYAYVPSRNYREEIGMAAPASPARSEGKSMGFGFHRASGRASVASSNAEASHWGQGFNSAGQVPPSSTALIPVAVGYEYDRSGENEYDEYDDSY